MKFIEKLSAKSADLYGRQAATAVFLGDSVTQGCFELERDRNQNVETVFDMPASYSAKFSRILSELFPRAQVHVVDSGISGDNAKNGLARLERDVFPYSPDLVVVAFGLNDCFGGAGTAEEYGGYLREIFRQVTARGAEAIYMTPNMMCSYENPNIRDEKVREIARVTAARQSEGWLDKYLDCGRQAALETGARVCDCHAAWKKLAAAGVDTTRLLANDVNHPTRNMHWLFAGMLVKTLFED